MVLVKVAAVTLGASAWEHALDARVRLPQMELDVRNIAEAQEARVFLEGLTLAPSALLTPIPTLPHQSQTETVPQTTRDSCQVGAEAVAMAACLVISLEVRSSFPAAF